MSDPLPYAPQPIPVTKVPDSPHLDALIERLAANAHDVWAEKRISEGWTYGDEKDAGVKKTPYLVAYSELPESEKNTDRTMVRTALKAAMAQGWQIEPPQPSPETEANDGRSRAWRDHLDLQFKHACVKGHPRSWIFDMNDDPEIASGLIATMPTIAAALLLLEEVVHPAWSKADQEALQFRGKHHRTAWCAIWSGTLAIVLAILQLVLASNHVHQTEWVATLEIAAVLISVIAVIRGISKGYHHLWLTRRQSAERLRILKFESLGWPELWCEMDDWSLRVRTEVKRLATLTNSEAHKWAMELDSVSPELPSPPPCTVSTVEIECLASFYVTKRLRFQKHYFDMQAVNADKIAWAVRWSIPLYMFFLSVTIVLIHGVIYMISLKSSGQQHVPQPLEFWLVGMAAVLPVLGYGLRAWLSAFEVPRSRNLFRAKARALEEPTRALERDAGLVRQTLQHITRDEHFFANEHREWCRLQMEAEWFL